jgi:hypothetical protein
VKSCCLKLRHDVMSSAEDGPATDEDWRRGLIAELRKVTEQLHLLEACYCPVVSVSSDKVSVGVVACGML